MSRSTTKYNIFIKSFGRAIRQHRTLRGLSQEALAERANLDRSYMSQIERGIKNATLMSICRLAEALEASPSAILATSEDIAKHELASALFSSKITRISDFETNSSLRHEETDSTGLALIVDDETEICAILEDLLSQAGFKTKTASNGLDAIRILGQERVRVIISDIRMGHGDGLELLDIVRRHYPEIPVFFITGYADLTEEEALKRGARGLFSKPFDVSNFLFSIKSATGF
jgi:CheY-like chemotaxis protein/DNA-binding XRE family transcriptional regulator